MNDLPLALKNSTVVDLYADDTTFYDFQNDIEQLETNLQLTLNSLQEWCRQNGMVINTEKTKIMLITSRQKRQNLQKSVLSLTYNNMDIRMTACDKILRVYADENLLWNEQFNHISKKLSTNLWLLSKIRSYLTSKHRLLFYNAYVKPHIEYCSAVWCNTSNSNINKINKLQRRACKLILAKDYNGLEASLKQLDISLFFSTKLRLCLKFIII